MKVKRKQLAEHRSIVTGYMYRLWHLKGERSRFVITYEDLEGALHRKMTEFTLMDIIDSWEDIISEDQDLDFTHEYA